MMFAFCGQGYCLRLVVLVCLVESGPWHGMDISRDIVGLLRRKRAGVVLRHVVDDEGRHFADVIHASSIVVRIRTPDCGQRRRNSCSIATVAAGALRSVDGL